jgi:hypothetical protein
MAGAGYKAWSPGEVVTAANVGNYLQDQVTGVYASAAARTTALGTAVSAGMLSYRTDDKALELYAGSAWQPVMQGNNAIINGDFGIWQRGTTSTASGYLADRFTFAGQNTFTQSRQTFTPGTAPVAGYEGQYYHNITLTSNNQNSELIHRVEDARTFAGQTVTFSFWARSTVGAQLMNVNVYQHFGTGGSPSSLVQVLGSTYTPNSTWTRYTFTATFPSVAGKTFGTNNDSYLWVRIGQFTATTTNTSLDIWGVQLESGSVATPFVRAGGTLQGELAACQRYYYKQNNVGNNDSMSLSGGAISTTQVTSTISLPVTMRSSQTSVEYSNLRLFDGASAFTVTAVSLAFANLNMPQILLSVASGLTQFRPYQVIANAGASYIAFSAEL